MMDQMMGGMGLIGLLVVIVLVLPVAVAAPRERG
jgi:hypothetical protein